MVNSDRGHNGNRGINRIDGVKPSSKPDLKHHRVKLRVHKELQNAQRREFEVRENQVTTLLFHLLKHAAEFFICCLTPEKPGPLIKPQHMRRRMHSDPETGRPENRFEHRAGAPLPVCAGHGENRAVKVNAHPGDHFRHPAEPKINHLGSAMHCFDIVEPLTERLPAFHFS